MRENNCIRFSMSKMFIKNVRRLMILLVSLIYSHQYLLAQQPVPVGGGSYAAYPPLNEGAKPFLTGPASWGDQSQKMTHRQLYVVEGNTKPIPTNDWWTDLIYSKYSGDLWGHPIVVNAEEYGIYVKYPKTWNANGTAMESKSQVDIRGLNFAPESAIANNWGDWTFDFLMRESTTKFMKVTMGHGLPFTWCEFTGVTPQIVASATGYFNDAGAAITFPYTSDHFGIDINGDYYGIFAPVGTSFTQSGSTITATFSGTQKFLVVAVIPAKTDLTTFNTYAYTIPRDSKVSWSYNTAAGQISTTWDLTTQNLKGGTETNTIQGWIPHHYKNSTLGFSMNGMTYATPRGQLRCAVGKSFTISYKFNGLLPNIPAPKTLAGSTNPYQSDRMKTMIDNYSTKSAYGADTYWGGKDVVYMGQYMMMANETGNTTAFNTLKTNLRKALEDWYTYTPGEPEHYFAMYPNHKSLVGMNASYGSDEFNDHHFHYGYYTYATAMLGLFDQEFLSKYQGMAKMVAKDYANWDRTDTSLPFFRNFDPWEGHSWAGGVGDPINGNGQESSSEAMQGWGGLYLLGVSSSDNAMRDAGIFGYSIESRATAEYWFDRDRQNIDYTKYTKPYNSNITSQGIGWWTWFSGDPVWMHSIQWLPISPLLKYLYENPTFAAWDYNQMWSSKQLGGWDAELGNDSGIGNVVLSYLQISDPDNAATTFDYLWDNNKPTAKDNYTGGITYYYTHSHRYYGEIQWDKYTNIPTSTIYFSSKTGKTTYVVYNPAATEQTCIAYNSSGAQIASFKVPAKKLVAHQLDQALTSITVTSPAITVVPGGTLQMTATGFDQYGAATAATVTWTVSAGGTISASGLFTAGATNGTYTVTAKSGTITGTKVIRVGAAPVLTTIQVTPANALVEKGGTTQYAAATLDQYNDPITAAVTWSVSGGGSINSSGLFTSNAFGNFTVTATSGSKTGTTPVKVGFPLANIALGKTTTASTVEPASAVPVTADLATDGNTGTRWSSTNVDPSWITVDLGARFNIQQVVLRWETAYGKTYNLQVSDDNATWANLYTQTNGSGGNETLNVTGAGRYVRMYGTTRGSTFGYSLWEFEVYGTLITTTTPTLSNILVTPSNSQIKDNGNIQLSAQGYDQNGNTIAITPTWQILGTAGTVSASGLYTPDASSNGAVLVMAKSGPINGVTKVIVETTLKASGLEITPATTPTTRAQVAVGIPQKFTAVVYDQFKNPFPSSATWSVSGGGTVTQDGFFNATTAGDFMIFAVQNGLRDTAFVTVKSLSTINIAMFKPVIVSSSEDALNTGDKAVDGNATTRWSSKWTPTEYLQVDLQNTYTLSNMVLRWENAYATKYNIQTSTDGTTWTTRVTQNAGVGGAENISMTGISARYIKLNCTERFFTAYGYSLFELEAYATAVSTTPYLAAIKLTPDVTTVNVNSTKQFAASGQDQFGNAFGTTISYSLTGGGTINGTGLFTAQQSGTYELKAYSGSVSSRSTIYVETSAPVNNVAPVANAGADKGITLPTNSVVINGTGTDTDGTISSYAWTQVSGPSTATLSGNTTANLTASALVAGTYVFRLTVTDNGGLTGNDDVNVVVSGASGGANLALNKTTTVSSTENAGTPGSSAVDGNAGTRWSSLATNNEWIYVDLGQTYNVNRVKITWEAALGKDYLVQIAATTTGTWTTLKTVTGNTTLVNDHTGLTGSGRYVRILGTARGTIYGYSIWELEVYGPSGTNVAPTANAGADKSITLPTNSVVINGTGTDSDGTISSYAWTRVSGPNTPTLTNANTANLTASGLVAGTYVFRLTVTDNGGLTGSDDVNVVVNPAGNVAPTANAGADKAITLPTNSVVINGTGTDSDGTISSYAWTQVSGPSTATLTGNATANLTASALFAGTYVFRLTVTDNGSATGSDDVNVVVSNATTTNLALNKITTVSSTENAGTPGSSAVDGNAGTRWSSAATDTEWIYVDLGASYNVNRVKITWETAMGKDYLVQIAATTTGTWTTMKTVTGNTTTVNDHTGLAGTGRYVRIYGTARGTQWGYSIWELEVYGSGAAREALSETDGEKEVSFYPNPVEGIVNINGLKDGSQITINAVSGREAFNTTVINGAVDISHLPAGMYIVDYNDGSKTVRLKLVKQ
jgi:endoglucanase Acf2